MKCPHCLENFNATEAHNSLFDGERNDNKKFYIKSTTCSGESCGKRIIFLCTTMYSEQNRPRTPLAISNPPTTITRMIYPKTAKRPEVNLNDVPEEYLNDYHEACNIIGESPKASAALSRRLLQALLRNEAKVKRGNLSDEIGLVIDSSDLPTRISSMLDGVREVGNFAAHPTKSQNTGEIVDVEPGEAELNLEVNEALFDHYFTRPKMQQARLDGINRKLKDAGKPTIEESIQKREAKKHNKK